MTSLRKSYKLHICLLRAAIPAVLALLLPLLGGCSADEPSDITPPASGSDGNLHLSFRMNTDAGRASTRTDDQGHPEEDAELPLEEAFNTRDFAFYIFAEGTDEASRGDGARLLYANFDIHNTTDPYTMITGAGGQYNVTVTLPARALAGILGHELQPDSDNPVRFRMILLANSTAGFTDEMAGGEGWGSSGVERYRTGIPHAAGTTTFGDVIQAAESFRFSYSDMHEDSSDSYGTTVDGVVKGTIPMFGSISAQASERQLLASRPYERIYFGEVFMLRSLAKLRVRDAIREKSADGFPRLHSARLVYDVPDAYMVPAGASEYVNGSQVHTMRVCNPAEGHPLLHPSTSPLSASLPSPRRFAEHSSPTSRNRPSPPAGRCSNSVSRRVPSPTSTVSPQIHISLPIILSSPIAHASTPSLWPDTTDRASPGATRSSAIISTISTWIISRG